MPKNSPRRLSLLSSIRNIFSKPRKAKAPAARRKGREIEALESRIAPAAMVAAPLADLIFGPGKTGATLDLSRTFSDPAITGTVVEVDTNLPVGGTLGKFFIGLTDAATPLTVDNFLSYVRGDGPTHAKYDNTIVHRTAVTPVPFVVQLGGYTTSGRHIPVNPPVHNEFPGPGLEVRGSLAMAKSGGDPNSATSEFFINLADNSANLDAQNGGFTVFGNVLGNGLTVVDAIAALPHPARLNAPFDELPLQGGYMPPGPIPLADFVLVKKAIVLPEVSSAPGGGVLSLSVQSDNPGLVTTSFTGTNLNLKYVPGKSGVANITVRAIDVDGTAVDETFSVTVKPNLVPRLVDPFSSIIVPGDKGIAKLDVLNTSGGFARGRVDIQLYLSTDAILDGGDVLLASLTNQSIAISGGGKATFNLGTIAMAEQLTPTEGDRFFLSKITPSNDIQELNNFTDDNVSANGHGLFNAFGTFNGRTNVSLRYHDADNTLVTATLTGGGFGRINATTLDAELQLTAATSVFGATTVGGGDARTALHSISVFNESVPAPVNVLGHPLGTANLPTVDLTGDFSAFAGIKSLTLGNLLPPAAGTDHTITIAQFVAGTTAFPKQTATLNFGRIADTVIDSIMPLGAFKALEWIDSDAGVNDSLTAPSLVSLTITGKVPTAASPLALRGDFNADVTLTNSAATLSSVSIAGFFDNAALRTAGSIAAVTVGATHRSAVFAGVNSSVASNALPTSLADFANTAATIGRFTIKGILGVTDNSDFYIAADKIGVITLRDVVTANGGALFGVAADSLTSTNLNSAGDFVVRVL